MSFENKKIVFIGHVWPEPNSSAAGVRMLQLIEDSFQNNFEVYFFCAALKNDFSFDLNRLGVHTEQIQLNDTSFNRQLEKIAPSVVVFDRFMTEEQFGWRVQEVCPSALRVLDTEDLHFLRKSRQLAVKEQREIRFDDYVLSGAKREIASILRCDLSLIISKEEMILLQEVFNVSVNLLFLLPMRSNLTEWTIQSKKSLKFHDRKNFVFIGNFLHEPNYDAVLQLKKNIWPLIRKELKDVELHVWGAYCGPKVMQLHQPKDGFYVNGRADSLTQVFSDARVLLAPLRFGAGIKGKLIDAMFFGVPSITSSIGAESMCDDFSEWGGVIADSIEGFVQGSILLYSNERFWDEAQSRGFGVLQKRYFFGYSNWLKQLTLIRTNLIKHRQNNFIGMLLTDEATQSLKYMSKWIEEKNKRSN
jgi:O-antigen biosynthesis protein